MIKKLHQDKKTKEKYINMELDLRLTAILITVYSGDSFHN